VSVKERFEHKLKDSPHFCTLVVVLYMCVNAKINSNTKAAVLTAVLVWMSLKSGKY